MSVARRLSATADDVARIARELAAPPADPDVARQVTALIQDVLARGDDALVDMARRFDCAGFSPEMIRVPSALIHEAMDSADSAMREALAVSAQQVRAVAEATRARDQVVDLPAGQRITVRQVPVRSAGVYVPGGRAAYPSSVLMAVVPAQVAGVERIAVATPCGDDGAVNPAVLLAAGSLGVDEIYAIGGAGAIAALAFGTDSVAPVSVITGPGNAWVAEAKRQVFGTVGIDSVAGPSEVMIIAAGQVDAVALAADLCAQSEHGPDSPAILMSPDRAVVDAVFAALEQQDVEGAITLVDCDSIDTAVALAEEFAPEHLQIDVPDAEARSSEIHHAGAVFLGPNGATAFGDYVAGSNHILPTGGAARYASSVSAATYTRRMSVVELSDEAVVELTPSLAQIAQVEGFAHHRRSAELRAARITGTRK